MKVAINIAEGRPLTFDTIVSLMINKSNNTDDKSGSTRTVVFFGVAIISLVAACTTFDGDEEVDLGGYSDIHEIQVADDEYLLIREREVQDWVGTCMRKAGFEYMAWLGNNYWTNEIPDSDTPTVDSLLRTRTIQSKSKTQTLKFMTA